MSVVLNSYQAGNSRESFLTRQQFAVTHFEEYDFFRRTNVIQAR